MYIELIQILRLGHCAAGIAGFLGNHKVQKARRRSDLERIERKIDGLIGNPIKTALSFLEMAKTSCSDASKSTYFDQALMKFVEASNHVSPDDEDWDVIMSGLAMCQYYKGDYINAIISLDKSLYSVLPSWKEYARHLDSLSHGTPPDNWDALLMQMYIKDHPSLREDLANGSNYIDYSFAITSESFNKFYDTVSMMSILWNKAKQLGYTGRYDYDFKLVSPVSKAIVKNMSYSNPFYDLFDDVYDLALMDFSSHKKITSLKCM